MPGHSARADKLIAQSSAFLTLGGGKPREADQPLDLYSMPHAVFRPAAGPCQLKDGVSRHAARRRFGAAGSSDVGSSPSMLIHDCTANSGV